MYIVLKNPNEMWATWKSMLMETIDKHAPVRSMCVDQGVLLKRGPRELQMI